jgi:primary-amine oxidase
VADVVCIGRGSKVFDAHVSLTENKVLSWELTEGVQPLITMEDLQIVESVVRKDPKVIEQCGIIGIPPEDMHKVYCDPWTIGYDERFGTNVRLQQALMYYRPHVDDSQYSYPLDFCPIFNADTQEIIHIDVPPVRRPLNKAPPNNYHAAAIEKEGGFRTDLKPIHITQPEGVSFKMDGRYISWANWKMHIGFNYREGMVLSDITFNDKGTVRDTFWRLSLTEMVVPYGNPEHPHQRKHAFDLGEYGGGYMTNSLSLGCDCKGAIHYMDAAFVNRAGQATTIKNAICIHEEDAGILFKHTDFRDDSVTVTRARKLIISHIFTAANYEYCVYWIFHLDGTIQLEIKLTGILNTYAMLPGEDLKGWGTEVYPGVNVGISCILDMCSTANESRHTTTNIYSVCASTRTSTAPTTLCSWSTQRAATAKSEAQRTSTATRSTQRRRSSATPSRRPRTTTAPQAGRGTWRTRARSTRTARSPQATSS